MARKIGLTPQRVLAAAAEIADRDGFAGVSLAGVAAALGVRSPSLYAHFDGLGALQRALCLEAAAELARQLREGRGGLYGPAALEGLCRAYLRYARQHPGGYEAVHAVTPEEGDTTLYLGLAEIAMPVVACLSEMGVPPGEMIHQTRIVRSALHGFASLEQGNGFGRPVDFDQSFERLLEVLASGIPAASREEGVRRNPPHP